jgi:membrane dipeptidase
VENQVTANTQSPEGAVGPGRFNFGLTTEQEARAGRLHSEAIVFDWLSQHVGGPNIFEHYPPELRAEFDELMRKAGTGWDAYMDAMFWPYELALQGRSDLVEQWYRASGLTCGTYDVGVDDGTGAMYSWDERMRRYAALPWLHLVTKAAEIRAAKTAGQIALYGHWQPSSPLSRNLLTVDDAYERGLRSLLLTYNRMDNVGVGCTERVDAGLSMFGVDLVRHCESLGVIVDVSHCGHMTTMDACRVAKRPVTANHTSAKSICDVARAKSDDALRAIADTGGVIGVVTVPFFVSEQRRPTIHAVLDQFDYIAKLVGWRHVSLGTDWPLQIPDQVMQRTMGDAIAEMGFRPEDRVDVRDRIEGFGDYRDLPNITRGLVARGYSDEQIVGILGGNALRVFAEVCG